MKVRIIHNLEPLRIVRIYEIKIKIQDPPLPKISRPNNNEILEFKFTEPISFEGTNQVQSIEKGGEMFWCFSFYTATRYPF